MEKAKKILEKLENAGYEGYFVGGCVRDLLLNKKPKDFDIATNAFPETIEEIFREYPVLKTGIKHGTVTVMDEGEAFEVTTYRRDGVYSDHRRPDRVTFTGSIQEDLARRDFTINAMAYNVEGRLLDPYGGKKDLKSGVLRCVGSASLRFEEDALRILRLLRFASELGFEIEKKTALAAYEKKNLLGKISKERIFNECTKIWCGKNALEILTLYIDILGVVLPELLPMKGFEQKNPHHKYDVLHHTAVVVGAIAPRPHLRWAALLHDAGKPDCCTIDGEGIGHFYGHAKESEKIAEKVLKRLNGGRKLSKQILLLIRYHDSRIEADTRVVKEWLNKIGKESLEELLLLKKADLAGQNSLGGEKEQKLEQVHAVMEDILNNGECYQLKDLQIDGNDLIENNIAGGVQIGELLQFALKKVIEGEVINEKEALLNQLRQRR